MQSLPGWQDFVKGHKTAMKNLLWTSHSPFTHQSKEAPHHPDLKGWTINHETDSPFARHNLALRFIPERFRGDSLFQLIPTLHLPLWRITLAVLGLLLKLLMKICSLWALSSHEGRVVWYPKKSYFITRVVGFADVYSSLFCFSRAWVSFLQKLFYPVNPRPKPLSDTPSSVQHRQMQTTGASRKQLTGKFPAFFQWY